MKSSRGFTLVEVLVSLIIVALGMGALLATLTSAADSTNYLRDKTFASWIALNRIAEQRLRGVMPDVGDSDGEIEYANRKWRWQQNVTNVDIPGLVRIDVSVRADLPAPPGASSDERPWLVTMSGIMGNAIATTPTQINWNGARFPNAPPPSGTDGQPQNGVGSGAPGGSPATGPATGGAAGVGGSGGEDGGS